MRHPWQTRSLAKLLFLARMNAEPVEGLVLENTGDTLMLNSVYTLDCMRYHSGAEAVT